MKLRWKKYSLGQFDELLKQSFCLYVFHHPDDGDLPYYIGKATYFGAKQESGYKSSARYNSGYSHLVYGLLRAGYSVYVAHLGPRCFSEAECYEQALIAMWGSIRPQKRIPNIIRKVITVKPWKES